MILELMETGTAVSQDDFARVVNSGNPVLTAGTGVRGHSVHPLPDGPEAVLSAYRRIIVGAHGSPTSAVAEEVAARLAKQLEAGPGPNQCRRRRGRAYFGPPPTEPALDVEAETLHRDGAVAESIVAAAAELRADLLVIGDHGMGPDSRFSLGGIPSQVAHHSPVDILVVRTADPTREHTYRKALLATDGSLTAHQATRHGHALARRSVPRSP